MRLSTVFSSGLLVLSALNQPFAYGRQTTKRDLHKRQAEAMSRYTVNSSTRPHSKKLHSKRQAESAVTDGTTTTNNTITFANPDVSNYLVNGTGIPEVWWDVGDSYAGLLPISDQKNEPRQLYFWFFPPAEQGSTDDLIIWLNGGPGCSSLAGFLQENGPISWNFGQARPTPNPYSWTNLSSVLWIEQPVGTGFSQGTPNIKDETDLATQFAGFLGQFLDLFPEMKGKNLYLAGESYAGTYVPYIADYLYSNPTAVDLNLQGTWLSDPVISWNAVQAEIPVMNFVKQYQHVFSFNSSFVSQLEATADSCGYTNYTDTYLTYPPNGTLPLPGTDANATFASAGCDIWDTVFQGAVEVNPAFSVYRIFDSYPTAWDVLGFPGSYQQAQTPVYFNRMDVKNAINAPNATEWTECTDTAVFPNGDASLPPAVSGVLANVIEKNNRTVIVHGLADFILMAEGTRIAIQNMTWSGAQGFQTPIQNDSFVLDGAGALGRTHTERGLTYYEVALSGHMVPQFSPVAAFQIMQYLLGFRAAP